MRNNGVCVTDQARSEPIRACQPERSML